jgi:hypothetical protein
MTTDTRPSAKPCPFCGCGTVSGYEGSTFRWWYVACDGCGAQIGETRIDTMSKPRREAIDEAHREAVEAWNMRAPQPEAVETDGWTLEEVHGAISKALDEAGIRNEVLRGQCIIAGLESLPDGSAPQTG